MGRFVAQRSGSCPGLSIRLVVDELVRTRALGTSDRGEVVRRLTDEGLSVTTTIDPAIVELAQQSMDELHPDGDRGDEMRLATIDNDTGAIVALATTD